MTLAKRKEPGNTWQRILDAAEMLFARYGYNGTSTRMIAAEAGISIQTLQYHCGGKKNLYKTVLEGSILPVTDFINSHVQKMLSQDLNDIPDIEQLVISPDAYGYLVQLIHLGIMKDHEMDIFVERALAFGKDDISVDDLKSIVASIIFDIDHHTSFNGYSLYHGDVPLQ